MPDDYSEQFDENLHRKDSLLNIREKENTLQNEMLAGVLSGDMSQNASIYGSNVITAQQRFNTLFTNFLFIGNKNDGLTEVPGTGTLTRYSMISALIGAAGSTCSLYSAKFAVSSLVDWDDSFQFLVVAEPDGSNNTYDIFLGIIEDGTVAIPADGVSVLKHVGFFIYDNLLYASNADGTTQTRTQVIGVTLNGNAPGFHTYRYSLTGLKEVTFYVDDVAVAKHTTNLPTFGSDADDPAILLGVEGQTTGKNLIISNNYSVILTLV